MHDEGTRLVGTSRAMRRIRDELRTAAPSRAPVLIQGESGTGKELATREIHRLSPRRGGEFVVADCGAIPAGLVESELFGHAKGSFTGAVRRHRGVFQRAHGGVLFLDELGNAAVELQAKLLRAIQERRFVPVGGEEELKADVRIVAATNRNLADRVRAGRFRQDLLHRVCVFFLEIPPLRERLEDLDTLVPHLLKQSVGRDAVEGIEVPEDWTVAPEAWEAMRAHSWPGNVRELSTCLERAVMRADEGVIHREDLQIGVGWESDVGRGEGPLPGVAGEGGAEDRRREGQAGRAGADPTASLVGEDGRLLTWDEGRAAHIELALRASGGNVTRAAELLGVKRPTLQRWIKNLDILGSRRYHSNRG